MSISLSIRLLIRIVRSCSFGNAYRYSLFRLEMRVYVQSLIKKIQLGENNFASGAPPLQIITYSASIFSRGEEEGSSTRTVAEKATDSRASLVRSSDAARPDGRIRQDARILEAEYYRTIARQGNDKMKNKSEECDSIIRCSVYFFFDSDRFAPCECNRSCVSLR